MTMFHRLAVVVLLTAPGAFAAPHRFLCTDAAGGTVSNVAAAGTFEWRYECQQSQYCWQLSNGNLLFSTPRV